MGAEVHVDVLIRGAGPVGCTAALALRHAGRTVALLGEGSTGASFRPIALSYASRLILERLGAWPGIDATPIESIRVSQAGGFGRTQLDAADAGVPALGYVTGYAALSAALLAKTRELRVADEVPARCVVHAEGWAPEAKEKLYGQHALVAQVTTDPPARATAFERFTPEGPLALLPLGGRTALIWSMRPERARALVAATTREFLAALSTAFPAAAGAPRAFDSAAVQPLVLRVRATRVGERAVFIGNAAQTLHPVAGQGLNLGMRDAFELVRALAANSDVDAVLRKLEWQRAPDRWAMIAATDFLARSFTWALPGAGTARGLGIAALQALGPVKSAIARQMMFGSR